MQPLPACIMNKTLDLQIHLKSFFKSFAPLIKLLIFRYILNHNVELIWPRIDKCKEKNNLLNLRHNK